MPCLQLPTRIAIGLTLLAFVPGAPAEAQTGQAMPVGVAPVVERDVPASIRLVGNVLAERRAVVAAEVSGLVVGLPAVEGQFVRSGEVLCELDPEPARLRLAEARARLGSLRAQLEELENGTRKETIEELAARVEEAQAILEKWEFERQRVAELFRNNQSSAKEKHDTEMEYLAARQRLTQAKAAYAVAVNGPRPEEIARARYNLAAQEAVVRQLERDLEKTKVRAPFDGFVVAKRTEVGQWVAAGGPVCELVAIDTVRVRADVPESAILFARRGAAATIEVEALRQTRAATITRVIPQATPAARTFPVEIDLPNDEHTLLPGMFVWAYVPAGPSGKRLMVPKDAIVARGASKQVFVVRSGPAPGGGPPGSEATGSGPETHLALPVPVTTGLELAGEIEIRASGIRAGDLVVVRANERLFGPTPVIPMPMQPPTEGAGAGPDNPAGAEPNRAK